jgi:N-dimethylarginine dimethylaminohydrolase
VLSVASSKDLNAKLRALGFTVYDPDMSQFLLAGGGVHCMSQQLRRDPV